MTNPPDIEKLVEALQPFALKIDLIDEEMDEDYTPDWSPFIPVSAYRNAAAALAALTPPEDQVTSETERSMLSGLSKRAGADHAPCPAASNGSVETLTAVNDALCAALMTQFAYTKKIWDGNAPGHWCVERWLGEGRGYTTIRTIPLAEAALAALSTTLPERDEVVEALGEAAQALASEGTSTADVAAIRANRVYLAALSKLKPSREGGEG